MPHQELYNKLFESNGTVDPSFLKGLIKEYPYFSIPHFFLLKATSKSDFNYGKVAASAALHFNNPYFLQYQLDKKLIIEESKPTPSFEVIKPATEIEEIENLPVNEVVALANNGADQAVHTPVADDEIIRGDNIVELPTPEQFVPVPISTENPAHEDKVAAASLPDNTVKEETDDRPIFEPLYTTDYFASQGIKLSEEVQQSDKLGKQLKSFTDWLKTMKKTHAGKLPEGSPGIDLAVQNLAEKSNKEQDVVTESMAEVYVTQGKRQKAVEIYKKLSLLNPSKSAYFAAKIEILNTKN